MQTLLRDLKRYKLLFLFLLPGFVLMVLFQYIPMFGVLIAFQDYRVTRGIMNSAFVGLKHFQAFFSSSSALAVIRNTLVLNVYGLLWGFPIPIIFAIMLCELRSNRLRKVIQTISYLPYFISTVIVAGIVHMLLSVDNGVFNILLHALTGADPINFLIESKYFRSIYVITNIWKGFGWTAIIYVSAIIGIDPQLYEAATVDGAGAFRRIWHITLPGIMNTVIIMLLLNIGHMMSSSFELVNLLQKPLTYDVGDTIATYVYRRGIANASGIPEYSFTTAIGLFQSIVNIVLLSTANYASRKYTDASLF